MGSSNKKKEIFEKARKRGTTNGIARGFIHRNSD